MSNDQLGEGCMCVCCELCMCVCMCMFVLCVWCVYCVFVCGKCIVCLCGVCDECLCVLRAVYVLCMYETPKRPQKLIPDHTKQHTYNLEDIVTGKRMVNILVARKCTFTEFSEFR